MLASESDIDPGQNTTSNTDRISVASRLFPFQSGEAIDCHLSATDDMLIIRDEQGHQLHSIPKSELTIEPRIGSMPRKVILPDQSLLQTTDTDLVDSLHNGRFWNSVAASEQFGLPLLLTTIACIVAVFGLYKYGLPLLVTLAVAATPDQIPELIDHSTLTSMDQFIAKPSGISSKRQDQIIDIFDELTWIASHENTALQAKFTLQFRDIPSVGPNAFALPGGTIVLTDQFVRTFESDDVIAGVLAHEIGHVVHEHSLRRLYRGLGIAGLAAILAGDTGPILEEILLEGNAILALAHSRKNEMEADVYSIDLLHQAGRDPHSLIVFFETIMELTQSGDENDFLSTHPATLDRIRALENEILKR